MQSIMSTVSSLLDKVQTLLTGEAARFIGYGSALVIVGVVAVSNALGFTRFGADISLGDALIGATSAITFVITTVESIRHFVFSLNTVTTIKAEATPASDTDVAEQGNG